MSVGVATARSQVCLKRLLDEPQEHFLKCKRPCLAPPPLTPGLSPCLRPRSPTSQLTHSQSQCRIGPYFLIEPCEGAETYRAVHMHTQRQYTCKVLPLRGYQERLAPYARLGHHDNVCSLSDVVIGRDSVYVFLPGHHGDMHAYVRGRKRLREEEAGRLFAQMLNAVTHCHQHGVVLRDLKLRKFVFTDRHRTALALQSLDDSVLLRDDGADADDALTDRHGCPAYVGPELLTGGNASYSGRAADIWSLGVSLYTMLIGRYPFQDTQPAALFAKIRRGTFSLPDWLSPQAKCLIGCMLRKSPAERLQASELMMHPWLTNPDTHTPHSTHTPHVNTHTPHHSTHTPHHSTHTPHHSTHTPQHSTHTPHVNTHTPQHNTHTPHVNTHTLQHNTHTLHQNTHTPLQTKQCSDDQVVPTFTETS